MATAPNGIPPAYALESLSYGSADLLEEPFTITSTEYAELQASFLTTTANPWVRVRGRVIGFDRTQGPFRVALDGNTTATVETFVNEDGTFEFPRILHANTYTARLLPADDAASTPRVTVGEEDVDNVEIVVFGTIEVSGRATVDGDAPVPNFAMSLGSNAGSMNVLVRPGTDGRFSLKLPSDERRVRVSGLPLGYMLSSMTYGRADLMQAPLALTADDPQEILVHLSVDPNVKSGEVRGIVRGLDPNGAAVRIELAGAAGFARLDAPVERDGAFVFEAVPEGMYVASLLNDPADRGLTPLTVNVSASRTTSVDLMVGRPNSRPVDPDRNLTGARVSDMGSTGNAASNEASAVGGLRTVNTGQMTYRSRNGRYGSVGELIAAGLLDPRYNDPVAGFHYSIVSIGNSYAVAAVPASQSAGRYGFYSTPDGVIRYSTVEFLAPGARNGLPVQ